MQSDIALRPELDPSGAAPSASPTSAPEPLPPPEAPAEPPPSTASTDALQSPPNARRHPPEPAEAPAYAGIRGPLKPRTFESFAGPAPMTDLVVDAPAAVAPAPSGPAPAPLMYPTKMRSFDQRRNPGAVAANAADVCPPPADDATPILKGLGDPRARSLEDHRAPAQLVEDGRAAALTADALTPADALKRSAPALGADTMRMIEDTAATVKVAQSVDVMLNVRHSDGGCVGVTIEKPASDSAVIRTFVCPTINGKCPSKRDASCHYVDMPVAEEGMLTM